MIEPTDEMRMVAYRDIKGDRKNLEHNPLAKLIRKTVGSGATVEVSASMAWVSTARDGMAIVELPPMCRVFWTEFEYGLHPGLISSEVPR